MATNLTRRGHDTTQEAPPTAISSVEALLIPANVAGPMCGRSLASWWRDNAAGRTPSPVKLFGRTLWRRAELIAWVEAGCPNRQGWDALRARNGGGK
jgi:predicted DNA-binding transcriptional regulator AlpA